MDKIGMTVAEAAEYIGISESHLRNLMTAGEIPGVKRLGRRYVISRPAIDEWFNGLSDVSRET